MNAFLESPALLHRIAMSDQDAMRDLIKRYTGLVWSLVRRKVHNPTDAEDLVQEIFADIWKSSSRYNPEAGSEDTFVAMIARRRVIDYIRKVGRRSPSVPFDGHIEHEASASPERESVTTEVAQITDVIGQLRPERQEVLRLSIVSGLSHSQIVEATGMPLGTVKAHLRRGLGEVRKILNKQLSAELPKEVSP
ncbi:MAG: RNA polymerase sigma factor [Phycisphaerales bacterium]